MNDSPLHDRLRSHLLSSSDRITLPDGDPARARRAAHDRTVRRRRTVVAGAVAASTVALFVGVQQLAQPAPESIRPADAPAQSSADPATSLVPSSTTAEIGSGVGNPPPAQFTDPAFVWKVVDPGQMNGISTVFSNNSLSSYPGFAVSTAPGRSNDYDNIEPRIWRTDDGVSWEMTELTSPFSSTHFYDTANIDGRLLTVGTAPGIAATEPNPLQIAVANQDGTSWSTFDLPLDTNAFAETPFTAQHLDKYIATLDDGVLIAVTRSVDFDLLAVAEATGADPAEWRVIDMDDTGVRVLAAGCDTDTGAALASATTIASPAGAANDPVPSGNESATDGVEACDTTSQTWAELGVPPETIDAVASQHTEFFHVTLDGVVTPVASPAPGERLQVQGGTAHSPQFGIVDPFGRERTDDQMFHYLDGQWVTSSDAPLLNWTSPPVTVGGANLGFVHGEHGRKYFATVGADGAATYTDPSALFAQDTIIENFGNAVASGTAVSAIREIDDPVARAGGVELTRDGVTVRLETSSSSREFLDGETGQTIDPSLITWDQAGTITIRTPDGDVRTTFTEIELHEELEQPWQQPVDEHRWSVVTTADGTNFSVESIADLLGVDESAINYVPRISSDGSQVVVAVSLNDRYPDETRKQLVLVGTPVG